MLKLVPPEEGTLPAAPDAPMRYWAFLSYSHHDKAIAKRLQKQLETYRVPRRLVGRETSVGAVPARVSPVFRDRDELHAGADLKASVQDALSKSRWLIVVCTPDAARSPWVNREIIEFKKLRGERQVLALIARGEPFASDMPGREAEECFPPALRRALNEQRQPEGEALEPIAADMRKEGDGPQRATLKLLAGMMGVSFDDLVRRDMQRRVRMLSVVAGAAVLGLVTFAFLAMMAVQARDEAQNQRMQAEGLIEFMLGDLRKKLEPVGRLEVLDSVGEKALAYYGAQESAKLDATALGHRSRAMHLIGEIRDLRGQPVEAQKAFEQAAETTAQLLKQLPNDGQRIYDHAQSVFWVADAAWKRGDGVLAEAKFGEYLQLAQRLSRIDPSNTDWLAEVAFAHGNLGSIRSAQGNPRAGLSSLSISGSMWKELMSVRGDARFELAQNYGWRAEAYELVGAYEQALQWAHAKLTLLEAGGRIELDLPVRREVQNALNAVSFYELSLGHLRQGEEAATRAQHMAEKLVEEDAMNLRWRADACFSSLRLAEIEMWRGNIAGARSRLNLASDCVDRYNATGTRGFRDSVFLEARRLVLAASLATPGERGRLAREGSDFLERSTMKISEKTLDREKLMLELANVAVALDKLQSFIGAPEFHGSLAPAEALLNLPEAQTNGAVLTTVAQARLNRGDIHGAQLLAERIALTSYRHPAVAALENSLRTERGGRSVERLEKKS
jgi:tetratricopeptide (TPR) repeat protein